MGFKVDDQVTVDQQVIEAYNSVNKTSITSSTPGRINAILGPGIYQVIFRLPDPLSIRQSIDVSYITQSLVAREENLILVENNKPVVKAKEVFLATIQIAIEIEESAKGAPEDYISELLDVDGVFDWAYLKVGGQYMYPTSRYVRDDYEEGELFN